MTIDSGLGEEFAVDGHDLSGAVGGARRISSSMSPLVTNVINKKGVQRVAGLRDGGIDFDSWFDDTVVHPVLSTLPTTDRVATWFFGTVLGDQTASIIGQQIGYDPTRGQDGSLSLATSVLANGFALEYGHNLTGDGTTVVESQSSAGALTGFTDVSAATDFGLQVYFHLFSFTGTSITLTIQDSDDDAAGDPYATVTGATSGALTTPQGLRVQTSATENVKEWLRVISTGTFSEATFAVAVVRNTTARWY